jgi:hypothetical protein
MKKIAAFASLAAVVALAAPAQADNPTATTDAPSGITSTSALLRGRVANADGGTTSYFEYGLTTLYGSKVGTVNEGSTTGVHAKVSSLLPLMGYHYRLVVSKNGGTVYGADQAFMTKAVETTDSTTGTDSSGSGTSTDNDSTGSTLGSLGDPTDDTPAVPPPVLGENVGVGPASGSIRVRRPGDDGYLQLAGNAPVPSGSTIDARRGTVNLVTSLPDGTTQAAQFRGAIFTVKQATTSGGMTDLYLRGGSFRGCSAAAPGHARVSAAGSRSVRRLWGSDHHGRFRTHGRHAVATVRGTVWSVTDRCDGTLTSVAKGAVSVRDQVRHKTVLVKAGHRYLARVTR